MSNKIPNTFQHVVIKTNQSIRHKVKHFKIGGPFSIRYNWKFESLKLYFSFLKFKIVLETQIWM